MKVLKADTGITVLFRHMPGKLVSLHYVVKCGAVDERTPKEFGLCHALEHMFFAGTQTREWDKVLSDFRRSGAYFNAFTSAATTEFEILVPKEFLEPAFEILADVMYNATFPEDRWQAVEKGAIINELLSFETDPEWYLEVQTFTHALGGTKKFHHPGGKIKSVKSAKIGALLSFKNRFYKGDNVFLCVAGDLTEDEVLRMVGKHDKWDPTPPEPRKLPELEFNARSRNWVREGCGQPTIFFLKPMEKLRAVEDILASELTFELLNNHLMLEIREKRGLCYGIAAEVWQDLPQTDYLGITTSTTDIKACERTVDEIRDALACFPVEGLQPDIIHQAKMDFYRRLLISETSVRDACMWMVQDWLLASGEDRFGETQALLKAISDEKIIEIAQERLMGDFKVTTLEDEEDHEECSED